MTWTTAALIVGGSSIAGGILGGSAAKKAAAQQAAAIREAAQIQERMFQQQRADLAPYREQGYVALKDIEAQKPYFTGRFEDYRDQYLDPSMEFRRKLGEQTTARMLNVGGGAISGNTLRGLEEFGQNLASTEYSNAFNRFQGERGQIYNTLANIAGMGQGAINTGVQASQQAAQNLGQLAVGQGQAMAAGTVGQANAYSNAFGGMSDFASLYALGKSGALGQRGAPGGAPQQTTMFSGPTFA
jgi:hypothetical protein